MSDTITVVHCATVPYEEARQAQRLLERRRQEDEIGDVLLLLEHPPVYTRGRRTTPDELPMGTEWYERQGIEVRDTDRGGRVTYHGPGQLVAYPIVSLAPYDNDVHEYVRGLERVMIGALAEHGVEAGLIEGQTGVWVGRPEPGTNPGPAAGPATLGARKIGSIGIHVSRGVTTHGLAVNVSNDLQPFEWVMPCGIEGCAMTSLSRELGAEQDPADFAATITRHFGEVFERTPVAAEPAELGLGLPAATLQVPR
jgi:lipoyl(octanoyl) transferase